MEVDKLAKAARLGAESLAGIHGSPVDVEAKHAQTAFTPHDKATWMTPYREESDAGHVSFGKISHEDRQQIKYLQQTLLETEKQLDK